MADTTEAVVPVSRAREELLTRRKYAYKARNEAAKKIQTWYRQGYRTASRCREEAAWLRSCHTSTTVTTEEGWTAASRNKVKSNDSFISSSSSDEQAVTLQSNTKQDNGTVRQETSFDRLVANETAIMLVMIGREPFSTLNPSQKDRVRRLVAGMYPQPDHLKLDDLQDDQPESCGRSFPVACGRGKELSKIPVRKTRTKEKHSQSLNASRSRFNDGPRVKKQGVLLPRDKGTEDKESVTKQVLPVKPLNKHQLPRHDSSNFKGSSYSESDSSFGSLDDQLQGEESSSTTSEEEHSKVFKMKACKVEVKKEPVRVENGANMLHVDEIVLHDYSTTSDLVSETASDSTLVASSSREVSHNHFTRASLFKESNHRKHTHNNSLPLVAANRKPKFLVPLPKKKLARQRSNPKVVKRNNNSVERSKQKNRVAVLVDAAVQTDEDSDSSCSPSHVRLPLFHSEQWSQTTAPTAAGTTMSPFRGTGSYSNVYAMKKQPRRKSVIRALKTPLCKPFEKKKATGYLQKYNKANKQPQPTKERTGGRFSPIYMESSVSLLTFPQSNPLPELTRLGAGDVHRNPQGNAQRPLALHQSFMWNQDQEMLLSQPLNYHNSSMSNYMNFWRKNKRT